MDSPIEPVPTRLDESDEEQYLNDSDEGEVDLDLSQYYEDEFATDNSSSGSQSEDEPVETDPPYETMKTSLTVDEDAQMESLDDSDQEVTLKKNSPMLSTSSLIEDDTQVGELEDFVEEVDKRSPLCISTDVSEDEYIEMEQEQDIANTEVATENDLDHLENSSDNDSDNPMQTSQEIEAEREIHYASLISTDDDSDTEIFEKSQGTEIARENYHPDSPDSTEDELEELPKAINEEDKNRLLDPSSDDEAQTEKNPTRSPTEYLNEDELDQNADQEEEESRKSSHSSIKSQTAAVDKKSVPKQVYTAKIEHKPQIRSRIAVPKTVIQSKSMPLKTTVPKTGNKPAKKTQPVRKFIRCEGNINATSRGDVKTTYSSMTTFHTHNRNISDWLSRKDEEKRRKQLMLEEEKRLEEEKKRVTIEMERKNFQEWLQKKVKQEHQKRAELLIRSQTEKLVEKLQRLEKHKQDLDNEERFKIWLQKKEEENRKKKRVQIMKEKKAISEKEKRIAENEDAYKKWLENSKFKQKPIPMNRGLDSLRSAVSVGYINPIPWVPNIEPSSLEE